jgi:hypothetical protein
VRKWCACHPLLRLGSRVVGIDVTIYTPVSSPQLLCTFIVLIIHRACVASVRPRGSGQGQRLRERKRKRQLGQLPAGAVRRRPHVQQLRRLRPHCAGLPERCPVPRLRLHRPPGDWCWGWGWGVKGMFSLV